MVQLKLSKGGDAEGYLGIFLRCPRMCGRRRHGLGQSKLHAKTSQPDASQVRSSQKIAEHEFKHTPKPHMGLSAGFLVDDTLTVEVSIERRNE